MIYAKTGALNMAQIGASLGGHPGDYVLWLSVGAAIFGVSVFELLR